MQLIASLPSVFTLHLVYIGSARAQELFEQLKCDSRTAENVFENKCMCDFLATMERSRVDLASHRTGQVTCTDGMARTGQESYPCHAVDLLSHMSIPDLTGLVGKNEEGSDIWGWYSQQSGDEIAIIGFMSSTTFVDVSVPTSPVVLGQLNASAGNPTYWRDIKTYKGYAYIVSENVGHGLQVCYSKWFMFSLSRRGRWGFEM